jgi:hypothetical protein
VHATLASIFILRFLAFHTYRRLHHNPASNTVFGILEASPGPRYSSQSELRPPRTALLKQPSFNGWLHAAYLEERIPWEGFLELEEPSQGVI